MAGKSHVDMGKIEDIEQGEYFEYKDIVQDNFPKDRHAEDGAVFNREVEEGIYGNIAVSNEAKAHVKYRKL